MTLKGSSRKGRGVTMSNSWIQKRSICLVERTGLSWDGLLS